jgi:hypothetical protein
VAKMLETETGSWLYLDIRVYSKNTPTKTGICFPKNEFSLLLMLLPNIIHLKDR